MRFEKPKCVKCVCGRGCAIRTQLEELTALRSPASWIFGGRGAQERSGEGKGCKGEVKGGKKVGGVMRLGGRLLMALARGGRMAPLATVFFPQCFGDWITKCYQ